MLANGVLSYSLHPGSSCKGAPRPNLSRSRRRAPGRATYVDICGSTGAASKRTCRAWPVAAPSSRRSPWSVIPATSPGLWMRVRTACFSRTLSRGGIISMDGCSRPTASAKRSHPSSLQPPRKRTAALTGCSQCSTAGQTDSRRRTRRGQHRVLGSDLAGTDAHCGGGWQVLATKAVDGGDADSVRAFALVNRSAVALSGAVDVAGPVTALWPWVATPCWWSRVTLGLESLRHT